jgi:CHAT domain-containing protein
MRITTAHAMAAMIRPLQALSRALALLGAALVPVAAPAAPISQQDSFRIGSAANVLCSAQSMLTGPALTDMFDRGYSIVCRDAAAPIGQLYALHDRGGDPSARLAGLRSGRVNCEPGTPVEIERLGQAETLACHLAGVDLAYTVYLRRARGTLYVAEGLAGYDSALRLGLASLVADRELPGEVSIATTGAGDPAAFARVQAGALDPQRALAEAYRRNNSGSYAEAAEFFAALTEREGPETNQAEALVNEALQKSNLGHYAEADALFALASDLAGADPVTARRMRNYRAMHLLNQGLDRQALAELDRPMPPIGVDGAVRDLVIDRPTSRRLSAESPGSNRLRGQEGLTPEDKAQILDGQALDLRGTLLRLQHRNVEAVEPLNRALDQLIAIRGGRIAATIWLAAQIHGELGAVAEESGDQAEAERQYRAGVTMLEGDYPGSTALLTAKGRLAGYLVRRGNIEAARQLYLEIVAASRDSGGDSSPGVRRSLEPYFEMLAAHGDDPGQAAAMFDASQILIRPGVAQTQAILARELSGGSDDAARIFRQSVTLTRDIERGRVELSRLEAAPPSAAGSARVAQLQILLGQWQQDQVATQARLASFPRYRAVSSGALSLADLQQQLRPGEAYYKMVVAGGHSYAILITPQGARAFRIGATAAELEHQVDQLRATISVVRDNQQLTYPFDVALAFRLYGELFGPVGEEIGRARHLIFEPDGAMLRLPPNLLVTDQAGVDAYRARSARPGDDGFDFRGLAWLGRTHDISTAVSARAFRDVRQAPPSRAHNEYLGFGQNAPVPGYFIPGRGTRGSAGLQTGCSWSLAAWNRPISAKELVAASRAIGSDGQTRIVTGAEFSDTAIMNEADLGDYRILHFATHGLVQAPSPDCPARPSLLTSFGGEGSDGLLSFGEIFDLRLDADLVILSACDTAAGASAAATEEAGLSSGGQAGLDGLVRAFVGAGGRMVIASHWPVPDDFNATERLITGLFRSPPGTGTAAALRTAQQALMDDRDTSHPYYWSGFALIGDGAAPVIRPAATASAAD